MEYLHARGYPLQKQPVGLFLVTSITIFLPLAALTDVLIRIVQNDFTGSEVLLLIGFLILSLLGTGLGIHRFFAHRSFKANRGLKIALGILASAGGIGPVTWFSATHRLHHRYADTERDPHTPNFPETQSLLGFFKKAWISAFGFSYRYGLFALYLAAPERDTAGISKEFRASVQDLTQDPDIRLIDRLYYFWMLLFFVIPGVVLIGITGRGADFWNGVIWGGLARMSCNQLIFAFINILGHFKGAQPFRTDDESRNLYWFALFSSGESLHNNHHAFPWTAKSGMAWWQPDLNFYFLVLFEKLGWATEVRVPTPAELARKSHIL